MKCKHKRIRTRPFTGKMCLDCGEFLIGTSSMYGFKKQPSKVGILLESKQL